MRAAPGPAAPPRPVDRRESGGERSSPAAGASQISRLQAARPATCRRRHPRRPAERDRLAAAAELRAFLWAVERIEGPWDVLAKLDGDLELTPETIAVIEAQLERDPRLGMAGSFLTEVDPSGEQARLTIRPEHVHGATKFYRRECYRQIAPLPPIIRWPTSAGLMPCACMARASDGMSRTCATVSPRRHASTTTPAAWAAGIPCACSTSPVLHR